MAAIGASARVACTAGSSRRYSIAGGASRHARAATYAPAPMRLASSSACAAASGAGELSFGWPASEAAFYAADAADTAAAAAAAEEGADPAEGPFDVVGLGQASPTPSFHCQSQQKTANQPTNRSPTTTESNCRL